MDDLDKTNIGIVNALIKLTKSGLLKWVSETFTKSSSECFVAEGSVVVVYSTLAQDRLVKLYVINDIPKHLNLEGVSLLNSTDHVKELNLPPLVALHRTISGSTGNLEVKTRTDFLTELNNMCVV